MANTQVFKLKYDDIPNNEPILKMKGGLWYRDNNGGYTNSVLTAGLYTKEEAAHCFNQEGNGSCGVFAIPIRSALANDGFGKDKIQYFRSKLDQLEKYI